MGPWRHAGNDIPCALLIVKSNRWSDLAKSLPRMTCDDLIQKGPGHNQFIILTDVHLCSRGDALRRDMDADMQMYVPIYSGRLMKEPPPAELKLLLEVLDDRESNYCSRGLTPVS